MNLEHTQTRPMTEPGCWLYPENIPSELVHNGVVRNQNPWDRIHIPKALRKGKPHNEINEMRKKIWRELPEVENERV